MLFVTIIAAAYAYTNILQINVLMFGKIILKPIEIQIVLWYNVVKKMLLI